MRIVALYAEDYPWDVRIDKLLTGLVERGHEVTLVCRNMAGRPVRSLEGGLDCRRVLDPAVPGVLRKALSVPAFFNPFWRHTLDRALRDEKADLLIVRDVPLAPLAIQAGGRAGIPVVVDMAENHPAMWRNVIANDPWRLPSLVMKNPVAAAWMERYAIQRADAVFVVVEEMEQRLIRLGVSPGKISVVSNTPRLDDIDMHGRDRMLGPSSGTMSGDRIEMIYVGFVTRNRGLQYVIEAMASFPAAPPAFRLHIVGEGPALPALRGLVRKHRLQDSVIFHGWVDHRRVPGMLARADIGIIPHLRSEHTDTTIPNKLFDYMARGLPVLAADPVPLARIVRQEDCGVVYADRDIADCAKAMQQLANARIRKQMGERGRAAVLRRYNWETDLAVAAAVVEGLAGRAGAKVGVATGKDGM